MAKFFKAGIVSFGKYSGKHATKLPASYCSWASENLKGFEAELEVALAIKPSEAVPTNPNAKQYKLSPRHFDDPIPNPPLNSRKQLSAQEADEGPPWATDDEEDFIPMEW